MIHFEVHGPEDGEVLFLSAGLGGLGSYWAEHLDGFVRRFRVVTYDQRGTGRSGEALAQPTSIEAMADDAAWVLDQLDVRQCCFIGHALGGLIGMVLAARQPERVSDLVIINGWSCADAHTRRCFDVRRDLLRHAGIDAFIHAQPLFLYPSRWMQTQAARLERDAVLAKTHFAGVANVMSRIDALLAFDATGWLPKLRCRTLLIASEDDLLVPPTSSEQLQALLPGSELVWLSGGHACNVTNAAAFERQCLNFFSEKSRPIARRC